METAALEEAEVIANTIAQNTFVVLVAVNTRSPLRCLAAMTVSIIMARVWSQMGD